MPLDDKEQKILEEIERRFYEEDPDLARAVRRIERPSKVGVRLSALGIALGLFVIVYFISETFVAAAGFVLLVVSATSLVHSLRTRGWVTEPVETADELDE